MSLPVVVTFFPKSFFFVEEIVKSVPHVRLLWVLFRRAVLLQPFHNL